MNNAPTAPTVDLTPVQQYEEADFFGLPKVQYQKRVSKNPKTKVEFETLQLVLTIPLITAMQERVGNDTAFWKNMSTKNFAGICRVASKAAAITEKTTGEDGEVVETVVIDPDKFEGAIEEELANININYSEELAKLQEKLLPMQAEILRLGPKENKTPDEAMQTKVLFRDMGELYTKVCALNIKLREQAEERAAAKKLKDAANKKKAEAEAAAKAALAAKTAPAAAPAA
jgi:hypothetical protein